MSGMSDLFEKLRTHGIAGNNWEEAFNNRYVNSRRPPLPRDQSNSDIVDRIMLLTQRAIVEEGGRDLGDKLEVAVSHAVASA